MRNHRHDNSVDPSNLNAQYPKSIKIDVLTLDERHDPQFFLHWTLQLDRYFTWYELTKLKKVKFATINLSGQAYKY